MFVKSLLCGAFDKQKLGLIVGSWEGARWVALRAAGREVAVSEVKQVVAMGVAWEVVMAVAATVAVAKAVD